MPCSIRIKASSIRLRRTTHGLKNSASRTVNSRKGTCLDNACIESFFSHLKTEKLYLLQCKSEAEIGQAVEEYIYFYNYQRFQSKLKQNVPIYSIGTLWRHSLFSMST
ncbi:IS3 family transposase [Paenibacillus sp. BJ-4]|uniref:IS3 family transposase n=1 Tax=Paenibacillus sp. BJ-4 TaxID=2878097 RepID=UPI0039A3FE8E